jgi:WD40 repeat protein
MLGYHSFIHKEAKICLYFYYVGQKGDNSDIVLWDYATKRAIFRLSEHDYEVTYLDFSHDDRLLISTGSQLDGKLFIWDVSNGFIVSSV